MRFIGKSVVLLAFLVFGAVIGLREYKSACTADAGSGEKAHGGHEHGGAESAAHANEGFTSKTCEEGLLAALQHQLGIGKPAAAMKTEVAQGHEKRDSKEPAEANKAKSDDHDHADGGKEHGHEGGGHVEAAEGQIKLTADQIKAAGITVVPAGPGTLSKEITVPGRMIVNANAQAKVVPKLGGTVAKVFKQAGENVSEGDALATLESRELADSKAEYLAALRSEELMRTTLAREERLWKQKVIAEQDYLTAKNAQQEATIKLDLAHQKLHTVGLSDDEIKGLPTNSSEAAMRFYDLRAPMTGKVTSRDLVMGQIVGTDKEVFSIADLSTFWVELAVQPSDLPFAKEGQEVRIQSGVKSGAAKIVAINPMIDADTRTAKVIAELPGGAGEWHLGDYVSAQLMWGAQDAAVVVPRGALQTIKGEKVVFITDQDGFRMRRVKTGREDSENVEILSGLWPKEKIAAANTFTLKAELGKAEAEHEH